MATGSTGPPFSTVGPDAPESTIEGKYPGFSSCMIGGADCAPIGTKTCLPSGSRFESCDDLIGSWSSASGVCGDPAYWQNTYCACVNNFEPCPMFKDPVCGNSSTAYQPSSWVMTQGTGTGTVLIPAGQAALCKDTPICVNLVQVGGASNVLPGTIQQCGSFTPITNTYSANTFLVIMVFILVVVLVWLLNQPVEEASRSGGSGAGRPNKRVKTNVTFAIWSNDDLIK